MLEIFAAIAILAGSYLTYSEDVRPILYRSCIECHQPGRIAPMSLLNYEDVRPWAKSIRAAVERREMPPFQASDEIGKFSYDPRLTDEEIETISLWVAQGARRGQPGEETIVTAPTKWYLGEPDEVFKTPKHITTENEPDRYIAFPLKTFEEDTYISGYEVRHSSDKSAHHAGIWIADPSARATLEGVDSFVFAGGEKDLPPFDARSIGGWVPGLKPEMLRPEEVIKAEAGSTIYLKMHYAPAPGEIVETVSSLGLHYFTGTVTHKSFWGEIVAENFVVPAEEPHFSMIEDWKVERDMYISSLRPHMHLRGFECKTMIIRPGKPGETLLHVKPYMFNWQHRYYFSEPVYAPSGSIIRQLWVWNNTALNPNGPDHGKPSKSGGKTENEMGTVYLSGWSAEPLAEPIRVVNGSPEGPALASLSD